MVGTTTVTYHFTPGAGDEMVQFQVVLFSEELPEFAGELDMDTFKFTLNGVEIGKQLDLGKKQEHNRRYTRGEQ